MYKYGNIEFLFGQPHYSQAEKGIGAHASGVEIVKRVVSDQND